ncbi:beta-ketoacyl-[acyl-carrier-protein] synthase family protein [Gemmata sp. G18]|uniref:3-oxoacyl-[acyl-carrier-protein] synthase 2 n=1 Tax=Gemmata palustris TaxID=2822762 RepID=A0ABS5BZ06_9BACT|nr:beta-ketoacyl-[acyl-carrier-protein] synthase family protein [Gemmata palustris]MBP3958662.1 beta-ketoacyl-[acyl-carrier-protein] synthase family protein [Gemmata palustris]
MRRRVVITGMGVISPLGHSVAELFAAQVAGRTAVGPIAHFDARTFPTTFASEVTDFDLAKFLPNADQFRNCGVNTKYALAAGRQALLDAGLLEMSGDRSRIGVYLGSGEGQENFEALTTSTSKATPQGERTANLREAAALLFKRLNGPQEAEAEMYAPSGYLADTFGLDGPFASCQTACAASSQAIGEATEMIRTNEADVMLAGGSHSMITPTGISGFNRLTALSQRNDSPKTASRPFDLTRDGFVIGEGAGLIVLEELEHAKARGANIVAELTGYGSTADAFRMTDPHPEGRGAIRCMAEALTDAGLNPTDIGYINAHGTSTQANDSAETAAIKSVFGDYAYKLPVSSSKSMLGHLIAAAGVVELIISMMALQKGVVPPTINLETPDPACDLDYVPHHAREVRFKHVLSNSFGFGGQNVALIASAFRG